MLKMVVCTILAILTSVLIILQPSYINDTLHSLTNPSEHFLSYRERDLLIITGIVAFVFIVVLVI